MRDASASVVTVLHFALLAGGSRVRVAAPEHGAGLAGEVGPEGAAVEAPVGEEAGGGTVG